MSTLGSERGSLSNTCSKHSQIPRFVELPTPPGLQLPVQQPMHPKIGIMSVSLVALNSAAVLPTKWKHSHCCYLSPTRGLSLPMLLTYVATGYLGHLDCRKSYLGPQCSKMTAQLSRDKLQGASNARKSSLAFKTANLSNLNSSFRLQLNKYDNGEHYHQETTK